MAHVPLVHSKGAVDRAGQAMVDFEYGEPGEFESDRLFEAIRVISDFRTAHSYPLTKVTMGLRSMVSTEGGKVTVGQRLKRLPRIIRKLHRLEAERGERSKLSRLEDVGGCRAVLADGDELQRVLKRLKRQWGATVVRERDYITEAKPLGYRAVHLVVVRDERRIEVQLRTTAQQRWADAIEKADSRLALNLKDGAGPAEMMEFFAAGGDVSHAQDYGLAVSDEMWARLAAARDAVIKAGYYSS